MKKKFKFNIKIIPERLIEIMMYASGIGLFIMILLSIIALIINSDLLMMIRDIIGMTAIILGIIFTFGRFFIKNDSSSKINQSLIKKLKPPDEYDIEFKNITSLKKNITEACKEKGYLLFENVIKTDKYEINIYRRKKLTYSDVVVVWYADVLNDSILSKLQKNVDEHIKKINNCTECINIYCIKEEASWLKSTLAECYIGPTIYFYPYFMGIDMKNKKVYLCKNNFSNVTYKKIKKDLDKEKEKNNV